MQIGTYLTLFNPVVEVVHSIAPGVPRFCAHKSVSQFLPLLLVHPAGPVNVVEQLSDIAGVNIGNRM